MSATETQSASAPDITVFSRVASIPLISSSWFAVDGALLSNSYLSSPYSTAKGLSSTAFKYTQPLQIKLAPIITRADGFANKAVDAVESRYPYPFHAKPEEVATLVQDRRRSVSEYVHLRTASAVNVANKTLEEKVTTPAHTLAQGIDQRFAPIIDYFEVAVTRLNHSDAGPSAPDAKYQYQRALALSKNLKDQLFVYSNEHLRQLQAQSVLLQRANETAQSITALATSSIHSAQTRIHDLSDNMVAELQKLQTSLQDTASSLQGAASSTLHKSTSQLQSLSPQLQQTYSELASGLSTVVTNLREIVTKKDIALQDKVTLVSKEVGERVSPLLDSLRRGVSDALSSKKIQVNGKPNGQVNGVDGNASDSE